MALSKGEAAAVLSLINAHHGNAQWDDIQLDAFHSELRADMTAGEAREAVRRFYAGDAAGRWCGSGDVNAIVRGMRNERKPDEAQIGRECEERRLTGDQSWRYRRERMLGRPPEDAARIATTTADPLAVEAPPASRRQGRGLTGMPALTAVIRREGARS